jgi:hydrogenase maturation protease
MHKLRDAPGEAEARLRSELEAVAGPGPVYALGLGYLDKADDGAGVLVAQALKKPFPSYSFSEHDGVEGVVLDICESPGPGTVFFVDAAELHSAPGTVRVVRSEDIHDREITTHRVAVALLGAMLERSGKRVGVICVQPGTIEFRAAVSEPVQSVIGHVASALQGLMADRDRTDG